MKHFKFLLALFATSALVGCGTEEPPNPNSNAASTPQATADEPASDTASSPQESGTVPADNQRSDDEVVQEDVRKICNAVYQGDVATVLGYTHPRIIDMMGGMPLAKSTLETAFSQLRSIDMKLESLTFPDAPTFLETDVNRFVIVPTKSIISANGQRAESLNYQFGIQEKTTTTWKYVEGSRINNQNVRSLFPDFPPDYEFPEVYRKKL